MVVVAVEEDHHGQVRETSAKCSGNGTPRPGLRRRGEGEQAGGQGHVHGLGYVEAAAGDLVATLDQERRGAQREGDQRQPDDTFTRSRAGNSSWRPPVMKGRWLRSMPRCAARRR